MTQLHNVVSRKEMRERLLAEMELRTTISFYKYFKINDPQDFRDRLYIMMDELHVFGRIYVASEGVNAQMSVPERLFEDFKKALYSFTTEFDGLRLNIAIEDDGKSFCLLKIKVRQKIVADGIEDPTFDMTRVGKYLQADQVNQMAQDKETIFVDMRNDYEYEVGHFENSVEIPSRTFKEQLPMAVDMLKEQKNKNIVMYCTGGIRCEKASAYMLHNGFENVYHIEGGIIEYARQVKNQGLASKFIGKNFVFDDRLGERITSDVIAKCHQCDQASDHHTNCRNVECNKLFIQCKSCGAKYQGYCDDCFVTMKLDEKIR